MPTSKNLPQAIDHPADGTMSPAITGDGTGTLLEPIAGDGMELLEVDGQVAPPEVSKALTHVGEIRIAPDSAVS